MSEILSQDQIRQSLGQQATAGSVPGMMRTPEKDAPPRNVTTAFCHVFELSREASTVISTGP